MMQIFCVRADTCKDENYNGPDGNAATYQIAQEPADRFFFLRRKAVVLGCRLQVLLQSTHIASTYNIQYHRTAMRWHIIVNAITIIWIVMFVVGFMAFDADLIGMSPLVPIPEDIEPVWDIINWVIWGVFVIDVYAKYRRSSSMKEFLRCNWLDLLFLVPFFRILLLLRVVRLLRIIRMMRMAGAVSEALELHFFTMQKILGFDRLGRLWSKIKRGRQKKDAGKKDGHHGSMS